MGFSGWETEPGWKEIRKPSGQVVKWPTTTDCKSVLFGVRWFESILAHQSCLRRDNLKIWRFEKLKIKFPNIKEFFEWKVYDHAGRECKNTPMLSYSHTLILVLCGSSSVGRATAFQAVGRGFEPRLPLLVTGALAKVTLSCRTLAQAAQPAYAQVQASLSRFGQGF
jgi:hypothetical protein